MCLRFPKCLSWGTLFSGALSSTVAGSCESSRGPHAAFVILVHLRRLHVKAPTTTYT